jgi:hypothetical protein
MILCTRQVLLNVLYYRLYDIVDMRCAYGWLIEKIKSDYLLNSFVVCQCDIPICWPVEH